MKSLVILRPRNEPLYMNGWDALELGQLVCRMLAALENVAWCTASYVAKTIAQTPNVKHEVIVISNSFLQKLSSNSKNDYTKQLVTGHDRWGDPWARLLFNADSDETYIIHVGTDQYIESVRLDLLKN